MAEEVSSATPASPPANRGLLIVAIALAAVLIGLAIYIAARPGGPDSQPAAASPSANATPAATVGNPAANPGASTAASPAASPSDKNGDLTTSSGLNGLEPNANACGTAEVPKMTSSGLLNMKDGQRYACIELASPKHAKIGAVSSHGGTGSQPNLYLIVSQFKAGGVVEPIIGVDDVFGTDPEVNASLGKGTYLVDVQAAAGTTGDYQLYFNVDLAMVRTGAVGASWAGYSIESCSDDSVLFMKPGSTITVGTVTHAYVCTYVPADTWMIVGADTTDPTQDLTLEVIGFDEDGKPERYLFNDDDLTSLGSSLPVVEGTLPAGSYIIGVEQYGGATAHDFTIEMLPAA